MFLLCFVVVPSGNLVDLQRRGHLRPLGAVYAAVRCAGGEPRGALGTRGVHRPRGELLSPEDVASVPRDRGLETASVAEVRAHFT